MLRLLLPLLLSTELLAAEPAATVTAEPSTDDDVDDDDDEPAERPETQNGVSGRLLFGSVLISDEGALPLVGLGVAYERELFGLLALELALEGIASPKAQAVLFELVVEKPVELNDTFGVYFGGGPTVGLHVVDGKPLAGAGGLAMGGVEIFLAHGLEIFVELDAALLYFNEPILEADVGTGVLYRF